jgi:23S rRNA pseudouridine1911/1915/1917 synthase
MSAGFLSSAMKSGQMHKEYIAVLEGVLPLENGSIETYMKRIDESIIVRRVCTADEGGDFALTKYKTVFTDGRHSVVKASPITGRTHQLRVHFSYMGCPIVGDDMYGKESENIARHALHASRLVFPHPNGKETLDVSTSPILPEDMSALIGKLFGAENYARIIQKITEENI